MKFHFLKNQEGSVAILAGISLLVLLGVVGSAVDLGRATLVRTKLQAALDAAGLAAASTQNDADIISTSEKYFRANFPEGYLGSKNLRFTITPTANNTHFVLDANVDVDNIIMPLVGDDKTQIATTSQVDRGFGHVEIVMVLDNTASMKETAGGIKKIDALKTGVRNLITQLSNDADNLKPNVYVSIVPFARVVKISALSGAAAPHTDWLAASPNNEWTGCVHRRASDKGPRPSTDPNDEFNASWPFPNYIPSNVTKKKGPFRDGGAKLTDPNPISANNSTPIVRVAWTNDKGIQGYYTWRNFVSYTERLPDGSYKYKKPDGTNDPDKVIGAQGLADLAKYFPRQRPTDTVIPSDFKDPRIRGVEAPGGNNSAQDYTETRNYMDEPPTNPKAKWMPYNSNYSDCPVAAIMPLTAVKATVDAKIEQMTPGGETRTSTGMLWGWRAVSEKWQGLWNTQQTPDGQKLPVNLAEDRNKNARKIMIIMTDGKNNSWDFDSGGAFSYHNSGTNPDVDGTPMGFNGNLYWLEQPNDDTARICQKVKQAGIELYTIVLQENDPKINNVFKTCATDADHYHKSDTGADLEETFENIGNDISKILIAR